MPPLGAIECVGCLLCSRLDEGKCEGLRAIKSLTEAWKEAQIQGWSYGEATLNQLRLEAYLAKWDAMETRRGQGTETELRPTSQAAAPYPRSISAVYGLDEQPLHIDGAHFPDPPDAVLLFCEAPNETPTNVLSLKDLNVGDPLKRDNLRHGIFIVGSGPAAFLAHALESGGRLRYDPNVMTPADSRAHEAVKHFASAQEKATAFEWSVPNSYLLIANRFTLHGRAKVDEKDAARKVTRVAYRVGAE